MCKKTGAVLLLIWLLSGCAAAATPERFFYLGWDAQNKRQIYLADLSGDAPLLLTEQADGVQAYAPTADGRSLAYTVQTDGQTEIWLIQLNGRLRPSQNKKLLTCINSQCGQLKWAADGTRLLYEKRTVDRGGTPGSPTLFWLDVANGETVPLLPDVDTPTLSATLSPNAQWVTYASPSDDRLYVYGFENGRYFYLPNQLDTPTVWHPDGQQFLMSDLDLVTYHGDEGEAHSEHTHNYDESFHLFLVDVATETRRPITQGGNVDDLAADWSPDGSWLLFGRKPLGTSAGRQLWIMRADGSELTQLTNDLSRHHGAASWSANGRFLIYQQTNLLDLNTPPQIVVYDLETGEETAVIPTGTQPQWSE